jgi:hypothetical protein
MVFYFNKADDGKTEIYEFTDKVILILDIDEDIGLPRVIVDFGRI